MEGPSTVAIVQVLKGDSTLRHIRELIFEYTEVWSLACLKVVDAKDQNFLANGRNQSPPTVVAWLVDLTV